MIVSIHQPHYLPWLPYVHKVALADLFILLDDAAYTKNGWQNRNKIKNANGWQYLTVPVRASLNQPIHTVEIAQPGWGSAHSAALKANYSKAPYYAQHAAFFEECFTRPWHRLADLNEAVLRYILEAVGIRVEIVRSSTLNVPGCATQRLVDLCRAVGATAYLSGRYAAQTYLEPHMFQDAGIELYLQEWHCPVYRQQFPKVPFLPDLSIVDLLFNEGPRSLQILQSGGGSTPYPGPDTGF
ncbi:MAG: WbqC family protein [Chthonomonadales bacterium]